MGRPEAPSRSPRSWPPTQYITRNSKRTFLSVPVFTAFYLAPACPSMRSIAANELPAAASNVLLGHELLNICCYQLRAFVDVPMTSVRYASRDPVWYPLLEPAGVGGS